VLLTISSTHFFNSFCRETSRLKQLYEVYNYLMIFSKLAVGSVGLQPPRTTAT